MKRYPIALILGTLVMLVTLGSANAGVGPGCPGYANADGADSAAADSDASQTNASQKAEQAGLADALPIIKVAPLYPREAIDNGIEGHVLLEFAVTEKGDVRDPVVVEAEPPGTFDKAALAAVEKFKYKPKVVDGKAVEVEGVRNRIVFEITDD